MPEFPSSLVLLDRDGCLIHERGHIRSPDEVEFYPGVFPALRALQSVAYLFIVTNQVGIGRGVLTAAEVDAVNGFILKTLAANGVRIEALYTCPHTKEDECACRKPKPFFLERACAIADADAAHCYSVGDHLSDVRLASEAGGTGVYLLCGHGFEHAAEVDKRTPVFLDLARAARWIVEDIRIRNVSCPVGTDVERAAALIREGGLVIFPTETVYGLGADALNEKAATRIFSAKQRPFYDPLIVHIADRSQIGTVAAEITPCAEKLMEAFWPGPLTLILPKNPDIPDIVTAGLATVGVRLPSHPTALAFLRACGTPVAAPSANKFGYVSPTETGHLAELVGLVDYILDGGPSIVGIESTIVDCRAAVPVILRQGRIGREELEAVVGRVEVQTQSSSRPQAPGMLSRHYSPLTPLLIWRHGEALPEGVKAGFLDFGLSASGGDETAVFVFTENLSARGDLEEAAGRFYAALRRMDAIGLDLIVVRPFPDSGPGRALNDKLQRAAGGRDAG